MILDSLANASLYRPLGPRIARGLAWLADFSAQTPDGRYDIDGDDLFALVQSYDTVPANEKKFESHRRYLDIQFMAAGTESIHYAPLASLRPSTDYDAVKDFSLYADPAAATPLHLSPGSFAIFFPADGHKPGCSAGSSPVRIKKVVIKALA